MANECEVVLDINTTSDKAAECLANYLNKERRLSSDRYIRDVAVVKIADGVHVYGNVDWSLDYDDMLDVIRWLSDIAPIDRLVCRQDEPGCKVYGYYHYDGRRVVYNYIPWDKYPDINEDDDDALDNRYVLFEAALREHGVEEVIGEV